MLQCNKLVDLPLVHLAAQTCTNHAILLFRRLAWNLEVMSKCFFMSVPSTWVMQQLRTCRMVSPFNAANCSRHFKSCQTTIKYCVSITCNANVLCPTVLISAGAQEATDGHQMYHKPAVEGRSISACASLWNVSWTRSSSRVANKQCMLKFQQDCCTIAAPMRTNRWHKAMQHNKYHWVSPHTAEQSMTAAVIMVNMIVTCTLTDA